MATVDESPDISPDGMADMEEVCRLVSEGKRVIDPALLRRIYERSEEVCRRIREEHGVVEWAVNLIREARDDE
jgi:hypothetical protein